MEQWANLEWTSDSPGVTDTPSSVTMTSVEVRDATVSPPPTRCNSSKSSPRTRELWNLTIETCRPCGCLLPHLLCCVMVTNTPHIPSTRCSQEAVSYPPQATGVAILEMFRRLRERPDLG